MCVVYMSVCLCACVCVCVCVPSATFSFFCCGSCWKSDRIISNMIVVTVWKKKMCYESETERDVHIYNGLGKISQCVFYFYFYFYF